MANKRPRCDAVTPSRRWYALQHISPKASYGNLFQAHAGTIQLRGAFRRAGDTLDSGAIWGFDLETGGCPVLGLVRVRINLMKVRGDQIFSRKNPSIDFGATI